MTSDYLNTFVPPLQLVFLDFIVGMYKNEELITQIMNDYTDEKIDYTDEVNLCNLSLICVIRYNEYYTRRSTMEWEKNFGNFSEVLPLDGNAIAITYWNKPLEGGVDKPMRICNAMLEARKGSIINLSEENQTCFGGNYWCGFTPDPKEGHEEFLVNVEHIFSSYAVARRSFSGGYPPPRDVAKYMVFAPLMKAELQPDLVLLFCKPVKASQILGLFTYDVGTPLRVTVSGSTCRTAIANPIVSGEIQLSFIDMAARKMYGYSDEELIVSFPYRCFELVIKNYEVKRKFKPFIPQEHAY